ncbi:UvrD-helicase domain-containing protein [Brevibacillus dissolubilis]|uniref:UvrD-helicase domain-containing protein n=1 Tax=Brevibacillus dissolubilis TaxID=1844116 RepID=UPI00210044DB|nr:UvrD-helicase domain-containing protein [Brevibacillus dissolubilis]
MICAIDQINNIGEKAFYFALDNFLDNSHVVYWNREVYGREFDFCILIPDVGIAVIEVKGWNEATVVDVPRGECIRIQTENGFERHNPRVQARAYRFAVLNQIKTKLGKQPVVFHMVCYPFISSSFYKSNQMDLISEPQLTFIKEDLASKDAFLSKLEAATNVSRKWGTHPFTPLLMKQVRSLFEPEIELYNEMHFEDLGCEKRVDRLLPCYSIISYIPANQQAWKAEIDQLVQAYDKGTRIYSMVGTTEMLDYISFRLAECLRNKGLSCDKKGNLHLGVTYDELANEDKNITIFNWQTVLIPSCEEVEDIPGLHIVDAFDLADENVKFWLEKLDEVGGINLSQYRVEHEKPRKNMLVKAGAGTGKTHTMILRVAYLCYIENIPSANLFDRIVMITFTKDAADNMKNRLKTVFQNYYLLTGQGDFMEMLAQVERMQISTIHSFARRIIEKLGTSAGYGQDLGVTSGLHSRRQVLEESLENYVNEQIQLNPQYLSELGLPIYELREKLLAFVSKLENKSVDVAEVKFEQFGTVNYNKPLHNLLITVLSITEKAFERQLLEDNRIFLGRLMTVLSNLVTNHPERLKEGLSFGSRYLFIDEFQDTDDVQIGVIRSICSQIGYWLFVVGDIKQCIYRFRGAEEKAFDHLEIEKDSLQWGEHPLSKNYRTDKRLMSIYQSIFEVWGQSSQPLLTYNPEEDALVSNVSIHADDVSQEVFFNRIFIESEQYRMEAVFTEVHRFNAIIREMVQGGKRPSKEERTIAILVRENWQADEIVLEGRRRGFHAIQTQTGGNLYQSIPALELCALLQALLYGEPEHLSHILQTNFFKVTYDRSIMYQFSPKRCNDDKSHEKQVAYLTGLIDSVLAVSKEYGTYNSWSEVIKSLRMSPILQVVRSLYKQLRPWTKFDDKWMTSYYRMNVDLLFEKILQGCSLNNLTLHQLTDFMVMNIATGRSEECRWPDQGEEDIQILCTTVHKSKGLEYGYVILPFASFPIDKPKRNSMDVIIGSQGTIGYRFSYADNKVLKNNYYDLAQEITERMNEETRVLYVAMTRAIRSFSWIELKSDSKTSWQSLLKRGWH